MSFEMPKYHHPDFTEERFVNAPDAAYEISEKDGVAPDNYHSTSMYPEYFKINGEWKLAEESRMDSCVILCDDGQLAVVEARNLKKVIKSCLAGRKNARRVSICTVTDLKTTVRVLMTSLYSVRKKP